MMKLILSFAIVGMVAADVSHLFNRPGNTLQGPAAPPSYGNQGNQGGPEANAQILRSESDIQPDGSYSWSYETDNGIQAQEQAQIQQLGPEEVAKTAQGSFSWTSPEGQPIQISYIADENGYQPQGDLPTPPPIPAAIQRALDWIASHPPQDEQNNRRF